MSKRKHKSPSAPAVPFQSLWARAGLTGLALGALGCLIAGGMIYQGASSRLPGGPTTLATAPLPGKQARVQRLLELELRAGEEVEVWEVQRPAVRGTGPDYSLILRDPHAREVTLIRTGSTMDAPDGLHAEHRGAARAQEAGAYVLEAQVKYRPREGDIRVAVHRTGGVGPDLWWFQVLLGAGILLGVGCLVSLLELTRWLLTRPAKD